MKRPGHARIMLALHDAKRPMSLGEIRSSIGRMDEKEFSSHLDYLVATKKITVDKEGRVVLRRMF
jgi:hypothetical protein